MDNDELKGRLDALTIALGMVIVLLEHGEGPQIRQALSAVSAHCEVQNAVNDDTTINVAATKAMRSTFDRLLALGAVPQG